LSLVLERDVQATKSVKCTKSDNTLASPDSTIERYDDSRTGHSERMRGVQTRKTDNRAVPCLIEQPVSVEGQAPLSPPGLLHSGQLVCKRKAAHLEMRTTSSEGEQTVPNLLQKCSCKTCQSDIASKTKLDSIQGENLPNLEYGYVV